MTPYVFHYNIQLNIKKLNPFSFLFLFFGFSVIFVNVTLNNNWEKRDREKERWCWLLQNKNGVLAKSYSNL